MGGPGAGSVGVEADVDATAVDSSTSGLDPTSEEREGAVMVASSMRCRSGVGVQACVCCGAAR